MRLIYVLHSPIFGMHHDTTDLDPHVGVRFGPLIRLWNRLIVRSASHILVHGEVYRQRLLAAGLPPQRVAAQGFSKVGYRVMLRSAEASLWLYRSLDASPQTAQHDTKADS